MDIRLATLVAAAAHYSLPECGNGILDPGEECDDRNRVDGDGCASVCKIEQACYDVGNTFSFFTWSDAYPGGSEEGVRRILRDAVDFRKYPDRIVPRFWIGSGDMPFMADSFTVLDDLNDIISDSESRRSYPFECHAGCGKFPYFNAVGNHDLDTEPGMTAEAKYDYWRDVVSPRLPVTLVGIRNFKQGPARPHEFGTTYSFDYKNAHFIIVNQYHGDPTYPTDDPVACIRDDLLVWIDQDLSSTDKPIRFVFGHEPAWPYCSHLAGYGADACPPDGEDRLEPPFRPRPGSGNWGQAFGSHFGDSLDDPRCPEQSRDMFWRVLADHHVIAHFVGHTHAYSSRLVGRDGTRRNTVSAYGKEGTTFSSDEGVWEVSNGYTHTFAGCAYVLTTIRDGSVTFEAYDQVGLSEPFRLVDTWSVRFPPGNLRLFLDPS